MRGADEQQSQIFSYLSPEARVRKDHPLRAIRAMVDEVLARLSPQFDAMYAGVGKPGDRKPGQETWGQTGRSPVFLYRSGNLQRNLPLATHDSSSQPIPFLIFSAHGSIVSRGHS
jgi:hypothetical protein